MNLNTHHSFNRSIAKELGINSAIILENMMFWLEKNKANNSNYYEGKYWTFNSISAYGEIFDYLTERQIRYSLDKLEEKGIIETGNFNKKGFDKTKWYTITDYGYSFIQNVQMVYTKCINGFDNSVRPIPDINTDINTDTKDIVEQEEKDTIPYKEIIDYLNEKANRNFGYIEKYKRLIRARFREGYTLDNFKQVINTKVNEWGNDDKMKIYLQPSTLFGTKFDQYLNQKPVEKEKESIFDFDRWNV